MIFPTQGWNPGLPHCGVIGDLHQAVSEEEYDSANAVGEGRSQGVRGMQQVRADSWSNHKGKGYNRRRGCTWRSETAGAVEQDRWDLSSRSALVLEQKLPEHTSAKHRKPV